MEPAECGGLPISACRSCGGLWFPAGELSTVLSLGPRVFEPLNELYPGMPRSDTYAGLSLNCPDCRMTFLEPARAAAPNAPASLECAKCTGAFITAEARQQLTESGPAEAVALSTPEPADESETQPATSGSLPDADRPDYVRANEEYVKQFVIGELPRDPARKLAIVTCMDARMKVYDILGLKPGDANVIRNAGGIVTEDVLRSLIVSHHLLGTREVVIMNHTNCGLLAMQDDEFTDRLTETTGVASATPATFYGFTDLDANVRRQVKKVKTHPWVPADVTVRGFVYDVQTGRLREVSEN